MAPEKEGYDQAVSLYSPEGRIYQVEYAREASKRGSIAVAVRYRDGVVIAAHKGRKSKLIRSEKIEKIHILDEHNVAATSGLIADSRILVDFMRDMLAVNKLTYGENVGIYCLAKELTELLWVYTEYGGVRPFGVALLLVGPRYGPGDNISIMHVDVIGGFEEVGVGAIGHGADEVLDMLEDEYRLDIGRRKAENMLKKALKSAISEDLTPYVIDICIVERKGIVKLERWDLS